MRVSDQQIKQLKRLISTGNRIYLGFLIEYGFYDWIEGIHELIRREKPMSFRFTYEDWYSKAIVLLENLQPAILEEFTSLYKKGNQKVSDSSEYAIWDFMVGNEIRRSHDYTLKIDAVKHNFELQLELLDSLYEELKDQV